MKRVLLITFHFPPDAAVGAIRPAQFAKYLPEFGWEPFVLTVNPKHYDHLNPLGLDEHPRAAPVIRTGMFRNPSFYYRLLKRTFRPVAVSTSAVHPAAVQVTGASNMSLREWVNFLLAFPDEQAGWIPFALHKAIRLIYQRHIDAVMTIGPPQSVHITGALLSRLTKVPWVADFRDPWSDDPWSDNALSPLGVPREQCVRVARKFEAWFMSQAALVTSTTQRLAHRLSSRFPQVPDKFAAIHNGYDPEEFLGIATEKEKLFTISYLGSLYHHRDPEPFIHALSELINAGEIPRDGIVVRFVGQCDETKGVPLQTVAAKYGLSENIEILPWLPRQQALEIMARSHVLLLLAEDQPLQIPGKIYDYLGVGSDMLAVSGEGATADLLAETAAAVLVRPGDQEALKSAIKGLYYKHLSSRQEGRQSPLRSTETVDKYTRRHLACALSQLLEKVSSECPR
jgi:glycosyltransferase involved in cell wall biosynthesis